MQKTTGRIEFFLDKTDGLLEETDAYDVIVCNINDVYIFDFLKRYINEFDKTLDKPKNIKLIWDFVKSNENEITELPEEHFKRMNYIILNFIKRKLDPELDDILYYYLMVCSKRKTFNTKVLQIMKREEKSLR